MNKLKQQGSILLISLALLVILTLMTFTVSNSVLLQEKMGAGNRDNVLALQVAEMALKDAEQWAMDNTATVFSSFQIEGNTGLYRGFCRVGDNSKFSEHSINSDDCLNNSQSYLKTIAKEDMFSDDYWASTSSRAASTQIACPHGDACPVQNPPRYQAGRYQLILLDVSFQPDDISGSDRVTMLDNQYQARDEGAGDYYFLYKVIATGTGLNGKGRRVLVSHFAAPSP